MSPIYRLSVILICFGSLSLTACEAKLKDTKTLKLGPGEIRAIEIPAGKSDRTVVVEVTASEPITAVARLAGDTAKAIGQQKESQKSFTLEFTQPANTEVVVEFPTTPKEVEVNVKLSSK